MAFPHPAASVEHQTALQHPRLKMLPSRGVSGLRPVQGLRISSAALRQVSKPSRGTLADARNLPHAGSSLARSTDPGPQISLTGQASSRQFSQIQRLGRTYRQSNHSAAATLRGQASALPRLTHLGLNPSRVGTAAGASRSLSLWPFGSSQQPVDAKPADFAATSSSTSPAAPVSDVEPSSHAVTATGPGSSGLSSATETSSFQPDSIPTSFVPESFSDLEPSILDIPEQIGYLKHLGLDFGWGPTAMCEWLLEHLYIYTGLPWWAVITAAAVGVRVAWFWPTVVGQQSAAKMALLQQDPDFIKASNEAKEVMWDKDADTMVKMKAQNKLRTLTKRAGASMAKTLIPPLAIVPFSYGMFRLLRAMSALPVPSLETGGFAWITDLTVYDPTYILPLASAALSALTIRQAQKTNLNPTPQSETMNKIMLWGLTPLMIVVTAWFPAAVQYFFFVFAVTTVAQGQILATPAVRRMVGLPPLIEAAPTVSLANIQYQAPSRGGLRGIMDGANKNIANLQKGIEDYTGGPAKQAVKKAQEYEKKRAQEEKEKAVLRMIEQKQRKASRRN